MLMTFKFMYIFPVQISPLNLKPIYFNVTKISIGSLAIYTPKILYFFHFIVDHSDIFMCVII